MKIMIIRHGEPDYSIDSLTEKGFREAEYLAERLKQTEGLKDADFYCSPLGRAKDTAAPTLKALGKDAEILNWLREFDAKIILPDGEKTIPWNLHPRLWTKEEELYDKNKWVKNSVMQAGDVEQIYNETVGGINELIGRYGFKKDGRIYKCDGNSEKTIVLFCHCILGMTILSYLLDTAPPVLWHNFFMPTSSVTTLITEEREKGEAVFRAVQIGDTSHLYVKGEPVSKSGLFYEVYDEGNPGWTQ